MFRPRVGGFVTSVEFKDGDMVHAGDPPDVIGCVCSRRLLNRPTASLRMRGRKQNSPSATSTAASPWS